MEEALRILILEDNPADAELVQFELEEAGFNFTAKVVMTEEDFIHALQDFSPKLILSDYDLPNYNGSLALAEVIRRCPETPFILVTGAVTEDRAIEILTQGAKDYVLKTRLQQRLIPSVQRAIAEAEEHRARKQAEAELREAHKTLEERVKIRTAELEAEITARKQAEKALKESDERQRFALETSHIGAWDLDLIDHSAYRSFEHDRIFGYADLLHQWTYEMFLEHVLPEDRMMVDRKFQHAIENNSDWNFECRIRRTDGETRWIWAAGHHKSEDTGKRQRLEGIVQDITERKQAEEELRQSEKRHRLLAETMRQGVVLQDINGEIIEMNSAAERILGKSREQFLGSSSVQEENDTIQENGEPFPDMEHPSMVALQTGQPVHDVIMGVFNPKLGDYRWISIDAIPVFHQQSACPSEVYTVFEDVTARKQAEEAMRKSEHLYRAIGESIDYGIWVCDPDGRNIYASKSFLNLVGLTQEQCSNFGWGDVLHPDDAERTVAAWKECVRTCGVWDFEHRYCGVDGQWHPILARGVPVLNKQGEVICWAGINLDISKLKNTETSLKERTQQLKAANKELESFSYSISHDLKAPLRAIGGYCVMFMKKYGGTLNDDATRMINVIHDNAEKMDVLIDDLLSFSKVSRNSITISEIDMDRLASVVWDDIRATNEERELEVKITKLLPGFGDRSLIRQVLFNLFSNAVKFTRARRPGIIEMSCYTETDKVVYCLKDNGVGFDMKFYDKLFGVFQRLHSNEEYEGTGIGLALVKRIINRHGGRVWAEGQVDEGATFYFTLLKKEAN